MRGSLVATVWGPLRVRGPRIWIEMRVRRRDQMSLLFDAGKATRFDSYVYLTKTGGLRSMHACSPTLGYRGYVPEPKRNKGRAVGGIGIFTVQARSVKLACPG